MRDLLKVTELLGDTVGCRSQGSWHKVFPSAPQLPSLFLIGLAIPCVGTIWSKIPLFPLGSPEDPRQRSSHIGLKAAFPWTFPQAWIFYLHGFPSQTDTHTHHLSQVTSSARWCDSPKLPQEVTTWKLESRTPDSGLVLLTLRGSGQPGQERWENERERERWNITEEAARPWRREVRCWN